MSHRNEDKHLEMDKFPDCSHLHDKTLPYTFQESNEACTKNKKENEEKSFFASIRQLQGTGKHSLRKRHKFA